MTLVLAFQPMSPLCWSAEMALYERGTPFVQKIADFNDLPEGVTRKLFQQFTPFLLDRSRNDSVFDSYPFAKYLEEHYPSDLPLLTGSESETCLGTEDELLGCRLAIQFFERCVHAPAQVLLFKKIHGDGFVEDEDLERAIKLLDRSYDTVNEAMRSRTWALRTQFSFGDCVAAAALYHARIVRPFGDARPHLTTYAERLWNRRSFLRILEECAPYLEDPAWEASYEREILPTECVADELERHLSGNWPM